MFFVLSISVDANACVGSIASSAIGSAHAETEAATGGQFDNFLLALDLCMPTTFIGTGQKGTWLGHGGRRHRYDYVLHSETMAGVHPIGNGFH